nr:MAG TPA: hypothetical protein [Caudoviricetes sp.]DAU65155.1 MAG TPA: hypothetical protein [Caudoviricetes sp.]
MLEKNIMNYYIKFIYISNITLYIYVRICYNIYTGGDRNEQKEKS